MKNLLKALVFCISTLVGIRLEAQPILHSGFTTNSDPVQADDNTSTKVGVGYSAAADTFGTAVGRNSQGRKTSVGVGDTAIAVTNAVAIGSGAEAHSGAVSIGRLAFMGDFGAINNNVYIGWNFGSLIKLTNAVNIGGAPTNDGTFSTFLQLKNDNTFSWGGLPLFIWNPGGTVSLAPSVIPTSRNGGSLTNVNFWPYGIRIVGDSLSCQLLSTNASNPTNSFVTHGVADGYPDTNVSLTVGGFKYYAPGGGYSTNNFGMWDCVTNIINALYGANVAEDDSMCIPGDTIGNKLIGYPGGLTISTLQYISGQATGAKYQPPFFFQNGGTTLNPPFFYIQWESPMNTGKNWWLIDWCGINDATVVNSHLSTYAVKTNMWAMEKRLGYKVIAVTPFDHPSNYTNSAPSQGLNSAGIFSTNLANDIATGAYQPDLVINLYSLLHGLYGTNFLAASNYLADATHNSALFQTNILSPLIVSVISSNLATLQMSSPPPRPKYVFSTYPNSQTLVFCTTSNLQTVFSITNLMAFGTYRIYSPHIGLQSNSGGTGGIKWDFSLNNPLMWYGTCYDSVNVQSGQHITDNWQDTQSALFPNSLTSANGPSTTIGAGQFNWDMINFGSDFTVGQTNANLTFQIGSFSNNAAVYNYWKPYSAITVEFIK